MRRWAQRQRLLDTARVGDILADAAEPAVAFVLLRCGVDDLGSDGLDRAVVCRAWPTGSCSRLPICAAHGWMTVWLSARKRS